MSEPFIVAFVVGVTPGKWARVWAERMPSHPLELRPLGYNDAIAALADGTADAAFVRLPLVHEHLSSITLYDESPVVVTPKGHAIEALDSVTVADLDGEVLLDQPWEAAVELVAANAGVAIMPQSVARALSRKDVVASAVTDAPTTSVALVWPADSATELVEEFIGIVRGRTANSSRGTPTPPAEKPARKASPNRAAPKPRNPGAKPKRPKRR